MLTCFFNTRLVQQRYSVLFKNQRTVLINIIRDILFYTKQKASFNGFSIFRTLQLTKSNTTDTYCQGLERIIQLVAEQQYSGSSGFRSSCDEVVVLCVLESECVCVRAGVCVCDYSLNPHALENPLVCFCSLLFLFDVVVVQSGVFLLSLSLREECRPNV